MGKTIRLTESDLNRLIIRTLKEQQAPTTVTTTNAPNPASIHKCDFQGFVRINTVIKQGRPFILYPDLKNPEWVIFREGTDKTGRGCAFKRTDFDSKVLDTAKSIFTSNTSDFDIVVRKK